MISVDNITVRFGGFTLLDSVSFQVGRKERIGLIGRNGAGKTTLLKIISGLTEPTEGKVVISGGLEIGYLPQQMKHQDGDTVYDEAIKAFDDVLKMEREIESINQQLAERDDYHSEEYLALIDKLSHLNESFELLGGSALHADVEKTLTGLGFKSSDMKRQTSEFSGGWRMRIELAKILLNNPDFILLDEPTNHLDIESIQWLEEYLQSYPGSLILISHDRAFLDKLTNRTIEISLAQINDYRVPYSRFVELRKERREQELAAYQNQQKMIKDTEEFIERFRYKATKAVQVQSRIKQLNKLERIEVEEVETSSMNLSFPPSPRSGREVVRANGLGKAYGDYTVLENLELVIERGEKDAFVGKNGEGKTTLMKIIAGELDHTGHLTLGQNLNIGYFAQNQDELLDENKTVFETVDAVATGDARTKVRDILGAFLFSGEDVDKKVKVLSGGERSRLSLALLLLQSNNLLLMDEPTNHLDMHSKDILKNALNKYDGTLIVVSHDRDFLGGLTDKVCEFRNRGIREHLGDIYEFLERRKLENLKDLERNQKTEGKKENRKKKSSKEHYLDRKENEKRRKKAENQLQRIEEEITGLENELEEINQKLSDDENISNPDLFQNYGQIKNKIDVKLSEWEKAEAKLEKLKSENN